MTFLDFKNPKTIDCVVVPIIFLSIVFAGHYGLFLGHTLLLHTDIETMFRNDMAGGSFNGWRPDIGLGMTFFFADSGWGHVWSAFRLWQVLFTDPNWATSMSVLILLWVACVVLYFFIRATVPGLNRIVMIALASLIIFGPLRYFYFFQRHWILLTICSGLVSLILYDFFKSPSLKHFYQYTLTVFSAIFLGSNLVGIILLLFTAIFFVLYVCYHDIYKNYAELWLKTKHYFLLNFGSGACILFLGAWIFYSFFLELSLTKYIRDLNYIPETFFNPQISLALVLKQFFNYFHSGLFSIFSGVMGIHDSIIGEGMNNVSPIFILVLIILCFQKSQNFWEYFSKFIILGYFLLDELGTFIPGIRWLFPDALNALGYLHMRPAIHVFELVLLAIFVQRLQTSTLWRRSWEIRFVRGVAASLSILYLFLLFLAFGAKFIPAKLNFFLQNIFQWIFNRLKLESEKQEFLSSVISGNVQLFHETMGWSYLFFYGVTFLLLLCFTGRSFPNWFKRSEGIYFSTLLMAISVSLAWAIYPLNREAPIWDRQDFTKRKPPIKIETYDRVARVNAPTGRCGSGEQFMDCVKFKVLEPEFGPRRWVSGYRLTHGFDFSGSKSFSQKDVFSLVTKFFGMDDPHKIRFIRNLQEVPAFSPYKIYDFAGVKYFLSAYPLPQSEKIKLIHSGFQFYLYQNMNTSPYYYLADRIETINSFEELYNAEKGVAYLWKGIKKPNILHDRSETKNLIKLNNFKFGEIEFISSSNSEEFLVVKDAWHPYWRAQIDNKEVEILKTNGVLKGIFVPPGSHKIRLFFDNKAYRPGIWISIFSWTIFIALCIRAFSQKTRARYS